MKYKLLSLAAVALISAALTSSLQAAGGADYGRGPETDPVAMAALAGSSNAMTVGALTINNGTVRTNLTVIGVINGQFTVGTTNIADGTLPGGVKASATNLSGTVPLGSIARTTGWTNTVITALAFNGSNEVVMTTKPLSYDGLVITAGAGVVKTNSYP